MPGNKLGKLLFHFNRHNKSGMRRLRRLLRSSGFENSVLEESALEIRRTGANPLDIALRVAMLAYFAFEMNPRYRQLGATGGTPEFLIELY